MEKSELSCGAIAGILGSALLIGLFFWQMPASKDETAAWAAWVQAFGTIGAIFASYFMARAQANAAEMRLREEKEAKLQDLLFAIESAALNAVTALVHAHNDVDEYDGTGQFRPDLDMLIETQQAIQSLSLSQPPAKVAGALALISRELSAARREMKRLNSIPANRISTYKKNAFERHGTVKTYADEIARIRATAC